MFDFALFSVLTPQFVSGIVVGALLLLAGISIGLWLARRTAPAPPVESSRSDQLVELLGGLFQWTSGFAGDVSEYRSLIDGLAERLHATQGQRQNEQGGLTYELLKQAVDANEILQQRLDEAEKTLSQQAEQVSAYLSEARTDALTGLPNRRAFDDELSRRLAEWRRHGNEVSVVLVDVDHFKSFNDRYGHLAGDSVLKDVAQTLREATRDSDLLARFGGEEFAVVLPLTDDAHARLTAERLRTAIQHARYSYDGQTMNVTVSCGAAQAQTDEGATSLLRRADEALYAAKDAGRNAVCWHNGNHPSLCPKPAGSSLLSVQAEPPSPSFGQVCENLRQRLLEVTKQRV